MATKAKIQIPKGIHVGAYQIRKMYAEDFEELESGQTGASSGKRLPAHIYSGWVENRQRTWILYPRPDGTALLWTKRDKNGGVIGKPIELK